MEILVFTAWCLFFIFLIRRLSFFRSTGLSRHALPSVFLARILCGFALVYLYSRYYTDRQTSDIFKFFDDSEILYRALRTNPSHYLQMLTGIYLHPEELQPYFSGMKWWNTLLYSDSYNESRMIIRFNALLRPVSFGYYSVHMLFMSFLALTGSTALYKTFLKICPASPSGCFLAAFLTPSLFFWTSGVLKEGIVLFLLGIILYLLFAKSSLSGKHLFILLFSVFLLVFSRAYLLLCLVPCLVSWFIASRYRKNQWLPFLLVNLALFILAFNLFRVNPKWDLVHILCFKRGEYIYLAERIRTGSLIARNYLDFHWYSIVAELPSALVNVLFRPHPFELRSPLYVLPALENIFLVMLAFLSIRYYKKPDNKPFLYFCINYVLVLYSLIGITTPVLGSIVRYRAMGLFMLVFILVQLIDEKRLKQELWSRRKTGKNTGSGMFN